MPCRLGHCLYKLWSPRNIRNTNLGINISDNTSADQFTYFATVFAPYRKNWLSTVKTLIKKRNVDVNSVDSDGDSALHKVCR